MADADLAARRHPYPANNVVRPGAVRGHGGYLTLKEARYYLNKAAALVALDGLTIHTLRHTAASLAISAGANIKVLQRMLGHRSAVMTLQRYGHLMSVDLDRIADSIDAGMDSIRTTASTGAPDTSLTL